MELRQIRYFLVVAEERSFTRAAERLHIVQSAVSQQIRRLERELGVELFDRSARQIELTDSGRSIIPAARRLLAAESELAVAARPIVPHESTLRLGTATGLGERLHTALRRLRTDHDIHVDLVGVTARERSRRLLDATLDAAIMHCAPGTHPPAGLHWTEVGVDPMVVIVASDHPLAGIGPVALARFAGLPLRMVGDGTDSALLHTVEHACRRAGFDVSRGALELGTEQDLLASVGEGSPSWTVYFRSRVAHLNLPALGLHAVELTGDVLQVPTVIATRTGQPNAATQQLTAIMRELYSSG